MISSRVIKKNRVEPTLVTADAEKAIPLPIQDRCANHFVRTPDGGLDPVAVGASIELTECRH
jgi:hypothetical protein